MPVYKNALDQAKALQTPTPAPTPGVESKPKKQEPTWSDEELSQVGNLSSWIDDDPRYSPDPDDLEEEDEKLTIANVLKEYAAKEKIPLDKAVELWTRGSGLTGKSSWADWVRYNASLE